MAVRFDDRVALVTGAGAGLGRIYALELAARGASVVVNDLGVSSSGEGSNSKNADLVVEEIKAAGGKAVANYDSVEFGDKIVADVIKAFGRIDIIINNAGIIRDVTFAKMEDKDWDLIQMIHCRAPYTICKAAWPHMNQQKYGRIVNVTSAAGVYGNFGQVNYASAKSSVLGFTKALSLEGQRKNIFTNCIAPIAASRMTETVPAMAAVMDDLKPECVAPLVLALSAEASDCTGRIFEVGAGWVAEIRVERSAGAYMPLPFGPEEVIANMSKIEDFAESSSPTQIAESIMAMMEAKEKAQSRL